ncbi:MAG: hypothetical protein KF819_04675 [Labilithrix sp.]|nr:hypothetical protein [Labilithrix sp.]
MTARQKIEGLTNSWYGYAVFGALVSLYQRGLGIWTILTTGISFLFTIAFMFFIGRRLLAKSSITRFVLVIWTAIATLSGAYFTARMGWSFMTTFTFSYLVYAALGALSAYMYGRSFRVLTDDSVKAYFG